MTKSKQSLSAERRTTPDTVSPSAFDLAFSKVAAELGAGETAALRSDDLTRTSSNRDGLDSVLKSTSPFKNFIPNDQLSAHSALSGLTKEFRESAKWCGPEDPSQTLKSDEMELMMLRLPKEAPNPSKDHYLVAVDRRAYKGKPDEISLEKMAESWTSMVNHIRPSPPDWYKAGAVIWDHLEFEVDADWTTGMLGLEHADNDMTRACQAALFNAFATCNGEADLETVLFALATFIHAHPRFADLTIKDIWHLPYGEHTAYRVGSRSKASRTKPKMRHRP